MNAMHFNREDAMHTGTRRTVAQIRDALSDIISNLRDDDARVADDPTLHPTLDAVLVDLRAAVLDTSAQVEVLDWTRGFARNDTGQWVPLRTP